MCFEISYVSRDLAIASEDTSERVVVDDRSRRKEPAISGVVRGEALGHVPWKESALEISASCMRESMLASQENAQSPDDCGCSTHCGPKREALALPSRWFGLYSAWTP